MPTIRRTFDGPEPIYDLATQLPIEAADDDEVIYDNITDTGYIDVKEDEEENSV